MRRIFFVCRPALLRLFAARADVDLPIVGELHAVNEFEHLGERLIREPLVHYQRMLELLQTVDINLAPLELANPFTNWKSELKVFEAALYGIATIASPVSGYGSVIVHNVNGLLAASSDDWYDCLSKLSADEALRTRLGAEARLSIAPRFLVFQAAQEARALYSLMLRRQCRQPLAPLPPDVSLPAITIVAPLYNKQAGASFFLESLRRQSYMGHYEVVLVDDCSPDESVSVVERFQRYQMTAPDSNRNMRIRVISAARNAGNCVSRNMGIARSAGDIVIVVDADCMFTRDFLALHARAHMRGDCDVAIGPINIETNDKPR
jgi:hypothetical protein